MAKKITDKEVIQAKLEKYILQQEEVENLINKYIELYNRLNGAIEATRDILGEFQEKESSTVTDSME